MNKLANILFVSRTSKLTGAENTVLALAKKLDKKYCPLFVLPDDKGLFFKKLKQYGLKTVIINMSFIRVTKNPFLMIWFGINIFKNNVKLARLCKKEKISIIICNSFQDSFYVVLASKIFKISTIIYIKNILDRKWKKMIRAKIGDCLAQKIIAVSKRAADEFTFFSKHKQKVSVIYDALDVDNFISAPIDNAIRDKYYTHGFNILNIGNLSQLKGQHLLLQSIGNPKLSGLDIKVFFLGDVYSSQEQSYRRYLIRLAKDLGIAEKVYFLGFREDVNSFLYYADLLVHCPTIEDAFPRVILEALSYGKIVIATGVGGIPEMIEDGINGFLVPPDASFLGDKINYVYNNLNSLQPIKENAYRIVKEKFDIGSQIKKTEDILEILIANEKSRHSKH